MNPFSSIPFLRILMPFVAGIVLAQWLPVPEISLWCFIPLLILLPVMQWYGRQAQLVLMLMDVFLLLYGIQLVQVQDLRKDDCFYSRLVKADSVATYVTAVNNVPVEKEKTIKCELRLLQVRVGHTFKPVEGNLIAYFKKPVNENDLTPGNTLLIKTRLNEVPPPQNPYEFDYKSYLQRHQVYHTAFVNSGCFVPLASQQPLNFLWKAGLDCKAFLIHRLKSSGLSQQASAICCALLTGYDDEIDRSVMDAFAHSGTLHVLSVSGLHIGLIYLVLGFLFDLFDRYRKYKLLKFCFITTVLWFFALITGFSAPVLRAVIMFNLLGLGAIYFRNDARNQLNILCVSAFILLSYDPLFISEIGFLLSYFALAGLICFQPQLSKWWQPSNRLVNYGWQSITASLAATLSTLPLTLFYFKQFPIWFFVCNLLVVPATFVLLLLALLLVLHIKVAFVINWITAMLIRFIDLFNTNGIGFIDAIHFTAMDVCVLFMLLMLVPAAIYTRSYRWVVSSLVLLLLWQGFSLYSSFYAKNETLLSVYQLRNTVLSLKNKGRVQLSQIDPVAYNFHVKPHLVSFNYPELISAPFNYLRTDSAAILLLDKPGFWPDVDQNTVTVLVLANDFRITANDMQQFGQLRTIVIDGSNNSLSMKKAQELSCKFGLNFYNTKRQGAYLLPL